MRRRRLRQARGEDSEINITPMLDVVFIMLIFFIVTSSFVRESGVEVTRPTAETAEQQERGNIIIGITESGQVWIDNREVDMRAVRVNVERLLAQNPESGVVVMADEGARTGLLVDVMDQARQAGAENLSVAARPR